MNSFGGNTFSGHLNMQFTESNEWRHTGPCKRIYLDKQRMREWIKDGEAEERVWANYYGVAGFDVGFVWGVEWDGFMEGCGERKPPFMCCKRGAQLIISIRLDAAEHTHICTCLLQRTRCKNRKCAERLTFVAVSNN